MGAGDRLAVWLRLLSDSRHDIDAPTLLVKHHASIAQREQRVVTTGAHVPASMPFRAALAHKDVSSDNGLAAILLDASALS